VPFTSQYCTPILNFPASNILILIALSTNCNTSHCDEMIACENVANMVCYHTWFVNPFVKLAKNDSLLECPWVKAVPKLGWRHVEMKKTAITFVSLLINKEGPIGD